MPLTCTFKAILAFAMIIVFGATLAGAQEAEPWDYSKAHGPKHWNEVNPICGTGHTQSPIDIVHPQKAQLPAISFSYQASPVNVINNGHTVQNNYAPGSNLVFEGKTYELQQFHFHHHSETAVDGKHTPMEAHLVHKDKEGDLLVVSVLLKQGEANMAVGTVWQSIGPEKEKANAPAGVSVNAAELLPGEHAYYTYRGSLTTPPCSENVTWVVMTHPMTVSKEQINAFAKLYRNNARPVQPLDGRTVQVSR